MNKKIFIFEFNKYFDKLWKINRSITGDGVRKTHKIISEIIPIKRHEIKIRHKSKRLENSARVECKTSLYNEY